MRSVDCRLGGKAATIPLTGCGKSGMFRPDMGYNARCVTRCGGTSDAWWRCQERGAVQLFELRSAGAMGSSLAADPEDCGRGAGRTDGGIREAVRQVRTAVDRSGEAASRAAVAGLLLGALGAAVDGAARL